MQTQHCSPDGKGAVKQLSDCFEQSNEVKLSKSSSPSTNQYVKHVGAGVVCGNVVFVTVILVALVTTGAGVGEEIGEVGAGVVVATCVEVDSKAVVVVAGALGVVVA